MGLPHEVIISAAAPLFICAGVRKEYDSCAVRTPRGEYEAQIASYSIYSRTDLRGAKCCDMRIRIIYMPKTGCQNELPEASTFGIVKNRRKIPMNLKRENMLLYAVTDRSWIGDGTLYDQVEQALRGGVTLLQLREKTLDEEVFRQEAVRIKELCDRYGVPLIINDNVALAKEIDAAGVHVGQSDMEAEDVRALLGPDKIIGVSARTVEQAVLAERHGADYLGVGAVFSTGTKKDAKNISSETLREICQAVSIPAVAIGGITSENMGQLAGSGIAGIAVVSAVFAQRDVEAAARELKDRVAEMIVEP